MKAKRVITHRNYSLEVFEGGKWVDAGGIFDDRTKRQRRSEFVMVNFFGKKARMVEYVTYKRQIGAVKDWSDT